MIKIPISKNSFSKIDDDMAHLIQWKWFLVDGYAKRQERMAPYKPVFVFMHHCIIGRPLNGKVVDHINGDRLDNRKENLRIVSFAENYLNKKCHRGEVPKKSKYVGVTRNRNHSWVMQKIVNGKRLHRYFKTED